MKCCHSYANKMDEQQPDSEPSYLLREEYVEPDSEDEFTYEEVAIDDGGPSSGEEDLSTALHNNIRVLPTADRLAAHHISKDAPTSDAHPEVVEDFVCNFLASNKMHATLEVFQAEWYRLERNNQLSCQAQVLPDVYAQNRQLEVTIEQLKQEIQDLNKNARLSKKSLLRIQKERDYHRMHHRRVVQEKEHLIADMKRLKEHYGHYEPVLQALKQKYQNISREKTLVCLERDRVKSEVSCLQTTLQSVQQATAPSSTFLNVQPPTSPKPKPLNKVLDLPPLPTTNRYRDVTQLPICTHFSRTGGFQPSHSIAAHSYAAPALDLHPNKPVVATASDDHTWRLWTISSGELLLSGMGHADWLSSVKFNPEGSCLATGSGDGSIKVWDLKKASCIQTLPDHQQPVWDVTWHWTGTVLASAAMDHTIKLWNPFTGVCLSTLRGHTDSVNSVTFIPFSNTLTSCSADKTVSLWDIRTGLCVHTYYGHQHACYTVQPSFQGYEVFSGDCFGNVFSWDLRAHSCNESWNLGHYAVNCIAVDSARTLMACASDDHSIHLLDPSSQKEWTLKGHKDHVLAVAFTLEADGLVSTAHDGTMTVWQ